MITASEIIQNTQFNYADKKLGALPEEIEIALFSEWAAENRIIPEGVSEYHGPFDPDTAPHLNEPLNRLHPDDPCTHVALMKPVQSGGTVTVGENAMGAYIKYKLGSILFLTSSKGIGKIRSSFNIDTLIDNSGLADLIKPLSQRMKRKTADNTMYKEFAGGIKLLISSYNSIGDLKSNTFHLIIRDEWDEAKAELKDQGDIAGIIEGRTKGVRNFKILDISTPTRAETSRIYKSFLDGDQREFFTPCPLCGEKQILELKGQGMEYGLTFTREKKNGKKRLIPETVRYTCKHCKDDFYESKKSWMLKNGVWIPQSEPEDPLKTSYHLTGLIAPETFLSWERICKDFIDTQFGRDLLKFKDFTINDLGNPWLAVEKSAKWEVLKDRAEPFCYGEVPKGDIVKIESGDLYTGPLILYAGVDVQGDRLELHVIGFGANNEKWSIDYQIFYGETKNINDNCWTMLSDWIYSHDYTICSQSCLISKCAIDSGWDPRKVKREKDFTQKAHIVYEFVAQRQDRFIAVMGVNDDKAIGIIKEARIDDPASLLKKRYNVSVSLLKEMVMGVITQSSGYGTIHFPLFRKVQGERREIPDEHFKQFLSERYQEDPKKPGSYGWFKVHQRNEPLDTFNYAIAAADFEGVTRYTNEDWIYYYEVLIG